MYLFGKEQDSVNLSVCYVETDEKSWGIQRIADIINGKIKTELQPKSGFPMPNLYNPGDFSPGIGVFNWNVRSNNSDPNKPFCYNVKLCKDFRLTFVKIVNDQGIDYIKNLALRGFKYIECSSQKDGIQSDIQLLLAYKKDDQSYLGILLTPENSDITPDCKWQLRADHMFVDVYQISVQDVLRLGEWRTKDIFIYGSLNLEKPIKEIPVDPYGIVQGIIRETPIKELKEIQEETTKQERERFKAFLGSLPNIPTILDKIQRECNCSSEEAEKYFNDFMQSAKANLNALDCDLETIVEIAMRSPYVQKNVEHQWRVEHQDAVKKARADAAKIVAYAREEAEEIKKDALNETEKKKKEKESLQTDCDNLTVQKNEFETQIRTLNDELETKKTELQTIESRLPEAIRRELDKASENVAEFLAKRCCYSSGAAIATNSTLIESPCSSSLYFSGKPLSDDALDMANSWMEHFETLVRSNLKWVKQDRKRLTGAFFYASYTLKNNLLLAGPYGERIANALSCAVCGSAAGTLVCEGDWNEASVVAAENGIDEIIVVKNALHSRWLERWPERLTESKKRWIFTCPFADDLTIQPRGLFDYLLPVLTEGFVDVQKNVVYDGCVCKPNFDSYKDGTDAVDNVTWFNERVLRRAKGSSIYIARLKKTLDRAFRILNTKKANAYNASIDKETQKVLFYLFGAIPYSYATGNMNALKGAFDGVQTVYNNDDWREFVKTLIGDDNDER